MPTLPESAETIFGRNMRAIREAKGLSQSQLSLSLEVMSGIKLDPSAVARMEKGGRSIRLNEAVAIANALGVPFVSLMMAGAPAPSEQVRMAEEKYKETQWRAHAIEAELAAARQQLLELRERFGPGLSGSGTLSAGGDDG